MPNQHQSAIKLFISYSRRETAIADVLVGSLEARSFEVMIDRRDLPFGELWQKELGEFIRLCDTVIWLVSPASITSKWVNWELDEVARRLMHDANVYDVVFSPDAAVVLTRSDEGARRWRISPTAQALVDTAKERAVRCLTREERERYFLPVAPPAWCVERNLWPYQGADWQAWLQQQKRWLAGGRVENPPALPQAN